MLTITARAQRSICAHSKIFEYLFFYLFFNFSAPLNLQRQTPLATDHR